MAHQDDIALMAHLMRRAGFGASRDELEARVAKGYDATVEELLQPRDAAAGGSIHAAAASAGGAAARRAAADGQRQLHVLPGEHASARWKRRWRCSGTACSPPATRRSTTTTSCWSRSTCSASSGMGNYRDLLVTIAKNPTMLFWLDNNQNHGTAVNENWGRELLELFSLGAGNYTEVDVREASRAFTGWTFETKLPRLPYGRFPWKFEYRAEDHDDGEKTFLGHKGNFNGEDIIDIVVQQPACAKFICRHLYNFFVADEPQVPAWSIEEPRDPAGDRNADEGVPGIEVRDDAGAADAVQVRLLQERPLPAPEVAGRSGRRHAAPGRRLRAAEARLRRAVDAAVLHGPGPAEPAVGRGLAHRQGVDQQRLADVAHQLRRGTDRQSRPAGRAGDHRPPEGAGHQDARAARRPTASICSARSRSSADTKKELTDAAKQWGEIRWDDASAQNATRRAAEMLQLIAATREYQFG